MPAVRYASVTSDTPRWPGMEQLVEHTRHVHFLPAVVQVCLTGQRWPVAQEVVGGGASPVCGGLRAQQVVGGGADQLGQLVGRHVAEHLAAAQQHHDDRAGRAGHPYPLGEWDLRALKQAAHLLLEVLVFSLVALVVLDLLERAMVSLVEEEQLGIVDDLIDEVVEER